MCYLVQGCGKVVALRSGEASGGAAGAEHVSQEEALGDVTEGRGARALGSSSEGSLPSAAEAGVAEALVAMVQRAPGGQVPASQLCSELYQKCPDARALVQKHDGLKGFVATPVLEGKVKFVADQVRRFLCPDMLDRHWMRGSSVRVQTATMCIL